MKITLVELPASLNGKLFEKPAKDFYSLFKLPSRALPILHAVLEKEGYEDVVQINPAFNKGGTLTKDELDRLISSDIVGISTITRTASQSYELAKLIKEYNPRAWIVMGGTHVSAASDEALTYCDIVCRKEGDKTFPELVNEINRDIINPDLTNILGISFKSGDEIIHNPDRPFLTNEELSELPMPKYREEEMKKSNVGVVITSRGCPFKCEYCTVIENFGSRFRYIDDEQIIRILENEIKHKHKKLFFADDSFAANPKRTKRLLRKIMDRGIKMPSWSAQVRVESANDDELLSLMKQTGCSYVYIGLESVNDETLKLYNKKATREKNMAAIKKYHKAGINVHGMFVLGADTDTKETIQETLDFARKLRLNTAQFFALTCFPGTKQTQRYEESGRILTKAWYKYDAQQVVIEHPVMKSSTMQNEIDRINLEFYSVKDAFKRLIKGPDRIFDFVIRILGKRLAKKIIHNHAQYIKSLIEIEDWRNNKIENINKIQNELINGALCEDTDKKDIVHANKSEFIKNLIDKINREVFMKKEYFIYSKYSDIKIYCQRVNEKLQKQTKANFNQLIV